MGGDTPKPAQDWLPHRSSWLCPWRDWYHLPGEGPAGDSRGNDLGVGSVSFKPVTAEPGVSFVLFFNL